VQFTRVHSILLYSLRVYVVFESTFFFRYSISDDTTKLCKFSATKFKEIRFGTEILFDLQLNGSDSRFYDCSVEASLT